MPAGVPNFDPFEEELPDIADFTLLSGGLDHEDKDKKIEMVKSNRAFDITAA